MNPLASAEFASAGLSRTGLANGSGVVGKYLTDSTGYGLSGYVPALEGMQKHDDDGFGGMHLYIPWWLWERKDLGFPRGYHVEIGGGYRYARRRLVPRLLPTTRRLRQVAEGLRFVSEYGTRRRFIGPRRDDPEQGHVL